MSSALSGRFHSSVLSIAPETWCFAVQGEASPGLMPRILELFAKRNLVPARWHSALLPGADELSMDIQVAQIDGELAAYIGHCMRQLVGVTTVLISRKG
jgi:hypothetical protein